MVYLLVEEGPEDWQWDEQHQHPEERLDVVNEVGVVFVVGMVQPVVPLLLAFPGIYHCMLMRKYFT